LSESSISWVRGRAHLAQVGMDILGEVFGGFGLVEGAVVLWRS
jgi:hypothetical protein